ncbi:hypothetical protein ABZ801_41430 [Actinomadura sp. NPDC047616]|uniref:hypothetical protein n=1 Tax=Actinomadura sp. NPDC047616 TaxID=3155914 RepID=UPI0033F30B2D
MTAPTMHGSDARTLRRPGAGPCPNCGSRTATYCIGGDRWRCGCGHRWRATPDPAPALPLAGADVYAVVMDRAGWRCECEARHPRHRGRCEAEHGTAGVRLLAGPTHPGPDPARTLRHVPAEEMRAWCASCWDLCVSAARRQQRAAAHNEAPAMDSLF